MSRTIRRKNERKPEMFLLNDMYRWTRPISDANWEKRISDAMFHSDNYLPMRNPMWWIHLHEHTVRRMRNRAEIRKILHMEDLEDCPPITDRVYVPYYW